ncbi:hypothetical protein FSS13T_11260 [Flavobacterium saliperosum S13]|uniref:Uncharacterized protein n=1 Tax=Flavobacterium saliperosum S13 TaxID=1341155 RepID=A0ABP3A3H7_9FLAO|nr:hypothetical protein FSS13T_11260 [Flavobacterium saliperosum S13]
MEEFRCKNKHFKTNSKRIDFQYVKRKLKRKSSVDKIVFET